MSVTSLQPLETSGSGSRAGFPMFTLFPFDIQILIFEESLAALDQPRIVAVDAITVPCFDNVTQDLVMGWQLSVENRARLHRNNPHALARSLLQFGPAGARVAETFMAKSEGAVWHSPRHCEELMDLDLCLQSDVLLLPRDLYGFLNVRYGAAACRHFCADEGRVRRLMIRLESLEEAIRWRQGNFDWMLHAYPFDLVGVFDSVLGLFPQCEELVVLVKEDGGSSVAADLTWSSLHQYVSPDIARSTDERCQELYSEYDSIVQTEYRDWPQMSFALQKPISTPRERAGRL